MLARATAFLVLGLIACLIGAFTSAAVGAEKKLTSNLPAASLYAGAATAIGTVAITASFEILAAIYLHDTKDLFALLAGGTAIASTVFVALILGDVWLTVPYDHWLGDKATAYRWAQGLSIASAVVLGTVIVLYFIRVRLALHSTDIHWLVGVGMGLAIAGGLIGMFRTGATVENHPRPLNRTEVAVVWGCLVMYLSTVILALP